MIVLQCLMILSIRVMKNEAPFDHGAGLSLEQMIRVGQNCNESRCLWMAHFLSEAIESQDRVYIIGILKHKCRQYTSDQQISMTKQSWIVARNKPIYAFDREKEDVTWLIRDQFYR